MREMTGVRVRAEANPDSCAVAQYMIAGGDWQHLGYLTPGEVRWFLIKAPPSTRVDVRAVSSEPGYEDSNPVRDSSPAMEVFGPYYPGEIEVGR